MFRAKIEIETEPNVRNGLVKTEIRVECENKILVHHTTESPLFDDKQVESLTKLLLTHVNEAMDNLIDAKKR